MDKSIEKKLVKWWQSLASGNILIVYKGGTYKNCKLTIDKWKGLETDVNVKAIITTAMSWDSFEFLIAFLVKKVSKAKKEELMATKNIDEYFALNYKKLTYSFKIYTSKDRVLEGFEK